MRYALTVLFCLSLLSAQDREPRSARAILRDFDRVSMPAFSDGSDSESLRRFETAIREGSLKKAALALELFEAHPGHARLPDVMSTRWSTFNNVTRDYPKVIVETSLLLESDEVREDLAKVALAARTRAVTWSPLSDNRDRMTAITELFQRDPDGVYTGYAMMDVAQFHLSNPEAMRGLFELVVEHWPDSAWTGKRAVRWLATLESIGDSFVDMLPADLRGSFAVYGEPAEFTIVQVWSGWLMADQSTREIKALSEIRGRDGIAIVGLLQGDADARLPGIRKAGIDWPQLELKSPLRVPRTPCYFVLDRNLDIVGITAGAAAAALRIEKLRRQAGRRMQNPVPFLRAANLVEAVSYVLLVFVAMPLKYGWDLPLAVKICGWIHGVLFAVFCWGLARVVQDGGWPVRRTIGVFLAALVPVVPFFVDRRFGDWIAEWRPSQNT